MLPKYFKALLLERKNGFSQTLSRQLHLPECGIEIMIECTQLAGKVVRSLTLFENGSDGPEISIDFEDGSNFSACLATKATLEAKWTQCEGGEPFTLKDYTTPSSSR